MFSSKIYEDDITSLKLIIGTMPKLVTSIVDPFFIASITLILTEPKSITKNLFSKNEKIIS